MSQIAPRKRYGLFSLAIALLILGAVGVVAGSRNYLIRLLGLLAVMGSTYLVRISNVRASPAPPVTIESEADTRARERFGRLMWMIGIALVPIMALSYHWLYEDAHHGYHEAWPLYVFVGVGLVCAVVWPYLVSRNLR